MAIHCPTNGSLLNSRQRHNQPSKWRVLEEHQLIPNLMTSRPKISYCRFSNTIDEVMVVFLVLECYSADFNLPWLHPFYLQSGAFWMSTIIYWWCIFAIARKSLKTENKAYRIVRTTHARRKCAQTHTRLTTRVTRLAQLYEFPVSKNFGSTIAKKQTYEKKKKKDDGQEPIRSERLKMYADRYCYETVGDNDWIRTRTSTTIGTHTHSPTI